MVEGRLDTGSRANESASWLSVDRESALPLSCGTCGARTLAGDRVLYSPVRGVRCAACGERLKKEQARARRAQLEALAAGQLSARTVYEESSGALTRRLSSSCTGAAPAGHVAALLFSAQKASRRAKRYGPTAFRALAYERKGAALRALCATLARHGTALQLTFGWGRDDGALHPWVLYVDLPLGQVSFHSSERYDGPDYQGQWDGRRMSEARIIAYCDQVMTATVSA